MKTQFFKTFFLLLIFTSTNCSENTPIESENSSKWTKQSNIPNDALRFNANVIAYNNEAFLLPGKGGYRFSSKPEILKYSANEWTQIATYDGFASAGNSKAIRNNDVVYIIGGVNGSNAPTDEVRAFSITDNTFNNETRFSKASNVAYTQTKAYFLNNEEFSSYDFSTDLTESLPAISTSQSFSTALITSENNIIYVLFASLETNNFFSFDERSKEWLQLSDFPAGSRIGASIVSNKTDVFAGLGSNQTPFFDIWKYDINTKEWVAFAEYPGKHFSSGFAFELDDKLFFGGGFTGGGSISNDVLNEEVYSLSVK